MNKCDYIGDTTKKETTSERFVAIILNHFKVQIKLSARFGAGNSKV
jgi:hypothetical protein